MNSERAQLAEQLFQQGRQQYDQKRFEAAAQLFQQALEIYQELNDRRGIAKSFYNLGLTQELLKKADRAIEFYGEAAVAFREIQNRQWEASSLHRIGLAQVALNRYGLAVESYQQALRLYQELGDFRAEAEVRSDLDQASKSLRKPKPKETSHSLCVSIRSLYHRLIQRILKKSNSTEPTPTTEPIPTGHSPFRADRLFQQGLEIYKRQQFQKAAETFRQAIALYSELNDCAGVAKSAYNLGLIQAIQGDYRKPGEFVTADEEYREAIQAFEAALRAYGEIGNRQMEASSLYRLGLVRASQRKYQQASESYQQALKLYQELRDAKGTAEVEAALQKVSWYLKKDEPRPKLNPSPANFERRSANRGISSYSPNKPSLPVQPHSSNNLWSGSYPQRREDALRLANQSYEQSLQLYEQGKFQAARKILLSALEIYRRLWDRRGEANTLLALGKVYGGLRETAKANECYQKATTILLELGIAPLQIGLGLDGFSDRSTSNTIASNSRWSMADQLFEQGLQQYEQKRFAEAAGFFNQSATAYQKANERTYQAHSLYSLGACYLSLKQYEQAIHSYQQALPVYQLLTNHKQEAETLQVLGQLHQILYQYEQAIEFYQQAIESYHKIGSQISEGILWNVLGNTYIVTSQFQQGIKCFQQALAIKKALGDRLGQANALGSLGIIHRDLCEYQQAIQYLNEALVIEQEIGDRAGEAKSLNNLGLIYSSLGQYQQAINLYQRSLKIKQELGNQEDEGHSLGNLGDAFIAIGQYQQAIKYFEQSLKMAQEVNDRSGEATSLSKQGIIYYALGQYEQAIECHKQSQHICQAIGERLGEATCIGNLGITYRALNQHESAIECHHRSLSIYQEINCPVGKAASLANLGNAYMLLKQPEQSIQSFQKALETSRDIGDPRGEAMCLGNLGHNYCLLRQYEKAIAHHQEALEIQQKIGDRLGQAKSLTLLSIAILLADSLAEAELSFRDHLDKSLAEHGLRLSGYDFLSKSLGDLLYTTFNSDSLIKSESLLYKSIRIFESLREGLADTNQVSVFETQKEPYQILQEVLVSQGKTDAALEISERGRARAFLELLARQLPTNFQDFDERFKSIAQVPTDVLPKGLGDLNRESKEQFVKPPAIHQIKQIAKARNATIVEYSVDVGLLTKKLVIYTWVVKPNGEVAFRRVNFPQWLEISLEELIFTARRSMGVKEIIPDRSPANRDVERVISYFPEDASLTYCSSLQVLSQLLIAPIADLLPQQDTDLVIFVPHQKLFLVPFAALQDANGQYLIDHHTLQIAPSIQSLEFTQQIKADQEQSEIRQLNHRLIVGNPTMPTITRKIGEPPVPLDPLSGAEQEARAIANLLNTQTLIGQHATKSTVLHRMTQASLIHLATHGILDEIQGLGIPGAIALAPDGTNQPNDGLLTASELLELKLQADLVVLSCCNTGLGTITGDGVIGLSRCLFATGVPSVIVSLWAVSDHSTAFFMTEFYRHWLNGFNKAQALRQAMLATKQQYDHPYHWSAFTLLGEAE